MTSGVVSGITTTTRIPARAPYAAHAAPALPAVGSASVRTPSSTARVTLDLRAQRPQARVQLLVAAIDLLDVVDDARALRAERGREERHARTNVGAPDLRGSQCRWAHDDRAMRVREHDAGTHLAGQR